MRDVGYGRTERAENGEVGLLDVGGDDTVGGDVAEDGRPVAAVGGRLTGGQDRWELLIRRIAQMRMA